MKIQYFRDRTGRRNGVAVAIYDDTKAEIVVGWSKCNSNLDKFNREEGIQNALKRTRGKNHDPVPQSMEKFVREFAARSFKYFQQAKKMRVA